MSRAPRARTVRNLGDPVAAALLLVTAFAQAAFSSWLWVQGARLLAVFPMCACCVILLILVLNALIAIYQDKDAENALEALKNMQAIACLV